MLSKVEVLPTQVLQDCTAPVSAILRLKYLVFSGDSLVLLVVFECRYPTVYNFCMKNHFGHDSGAALSQLLVFSLLY